MFDSLFRKKKMIERVFLFAVIYTNFLINNASIVSNKLYMICKIVNCKNVFVNLKYKISLYTAHITVHVTFAVEAFNF